MLCVALSIESLQIVTASKLRATRAGLGQNWVVIIIQGISLQQWTKPKLVTLWRKQMAEEMENEKLIMKHVYPMWLFCIINRCNIISLAFVQIWLAGRFNKQHYKTKAGTVMANSYWKRDIIKEQICNLTVSLFMRAWGCTTYYIGEQFTLFYVNIQFIDG